MVAEFDLILGFNCAFGEFGVATATLQYMEAIAKGERVQVQYKDSYMNMVFTGYVVDVTLTENGTGYEITLADPLTAEMPTTFPYPPTGFPRDGTAEEIVSWCEENGYKFYYTSYGEYIFYTRTTGVTIPNREITSRVTRYGVNDGGFCNRVVVSGSAEKEIVAPIEMVELNIGGVRIREKFQGDRMLSRMVWMEDSEQEESWSWNQDNICTEYRSLSKYPAPPQYGGAMNQSETIYNVVSYNENLSAYRIEQTTTERGWGVAITGAQTTQNKLYSLRTEKTVIIRNADGTGEKNVVVEEIAANKYNSTRLIPVVDPETGEQTGQEAVTTPLFDYYRLLPASREYTIYRRKKGRPYSITRSYEGKLSPGATYSVTLVPTGSTHGTDDPELPMQEEALTTISANVEHVLDADTSYGVSERQFTLPDEVPPESIQTQAALQRWLERRAEEYAKAKLEKARLLDERTWTVPIVSTAAIQWFPLGYLADSGYEVFERSITMNPSEYTLVVRGRKASTAALPRRSKSTFGGMAVQIMRRLDRRQDNVRQADVIKPVSSRRVLASIGGKVYKTENPNGGSLFAGDSTLAYRSTGSTTTGEMRS